VLIIPRLLEADLLEAHGLNPSEYSVLQQPFRGTGCTEVTRSAGSLARSESANARSAGLLAEWEAIPVSTFSPAVVLAKKWPLY
jgi:hypothetical protein